MSQEAPRAIETGKQVEWFNATPRGPSVNWSAGTPRRWFSPDGMGVKLYAVSIPQPSRRMLLSPVI